VDTDIELLRRLAGLRDASVEEVVWRKADRSLRLTIADASGSFEVTLVGIDGLTVETALFRGVFRISRIDVDTHPDGLDVRIGLGEAGSDIRLRCREIRGTIA
jgi:hypothetical protein